MRLKADASYTRVVHDRRPRPDPDDVGIARGCEKYPNEGNASSTPTGATTTTTATRVGAGEDDATVMAKKSSKKPSSNAVLMPTVDARARSTVG